MVDLDQAGERLRTLDLGSPTPVAQIRTRAKRRTRARRAAATAVALAFLTAVAGSVIALRPHSNDRPVSTVNVGTRPTRQSDPNPIREGPHPAGSTRIDYGQLRLWLPPGWHGVPASTDCPQADTVIYGTPPDTCPRTGPWVIVQPITGPVPKSSSRTDTLNGWPVVERQIATSPAPAFDIWVPDLGVELTPVGSEGPNGPAAVIGSLGESSLNVLVHYPTAVPAPASWQTVTYQGFTVRVPPTWPVKTDLNESGACEPLPAFTTPVVDVSPRKYAPECHDALQTLTGGNGLSLSYGPPDRLFGEGNIGKGNIIPIPMTSAKTVHDHGVTLTIAYATGQFSTSAVVEIATKTTTITALLGLGANPTIPEQILNSLRPQQLRSHPAT